MTDTGSGERSEDQAPQNLRIIPPDGGEVRDGDGDDGGAPHPEASAPAPESEPGPALKRIKVLSDAAEETPGSEPAPEREPPLPAMAPGTGGSRLDTEDFDTAEVTVEVTEEVTAEVAGEETSEVAGEETSEDVASDVPAADRDSSEETPAASEGSPEDGAPTASTPLPPPPFTAPGVPGVRLQRTPPQVHQAAGAAGAGGDEDADTPVIRVTADRVPPASAPRSPVAAEDGEQVWSEPPRRPPAVPPEDGDAALYVPEGSVVSPSPVVKVATGIGFGLVTLVVILLGKTAFAVLIALLVTWVSVEFFAALYQSLTGDEEAIEGPEGGAAEDGDATQLIDAGTEPAGLAPPRGVLQLTRRPAAYVAVAGTLGAVVTAYLFGVESLGAVALGATMACLLWFAAGVERGAAPLEASLSVLGFVHVAVLGSFAMLILRLEHGFALLLVIVVLTVVCDVACYAWGSSFGHTPFFASASPNKSLEGFVGGVATTLAAGGIVVLLQGWLYDSVPTLGNLVRVLALALLVSVAATAGDLAESLFKRDLGIKDVAALLPGHGGFFDRLDGMVFALPVAYVAMRLMGIADVG